MQANKIVRAVIYARVSSREQATEGNSISSQLALLEEYAFEKQLKVERRFTEVESAKSAGRTEFKKMIQFLKENPTIKSILVEKTDRLYRNFQDYALLDSGLKLHFVKEGVVIDSESRSHDKLTHGFKVLIAKNYIDNLSEEVKKGFAEKIKLGQWPGKAPVGYKNNLENHTIELCPTKSVFIKKAFELASTGNYSLLKLCTELYNMGIKGERSGKKFTKQQMKRILENNFYYGRMTIKGVDYKGSHEPLVSKELFVKAQEGMGYLKKPNQSKHDFVFRGQMICHNCGCQITAEKKIKNSGKTYTYYHCTNGKSNCTRSYVREENIEEQLLEAFSKIQIPSEVIEYTRSFLLSHQKEEQAFREKELNQLNLLYQKVTERIEKLYTDKIDGTIELEIWKTRNNKYSSEQDELLARIKALQEANADYMLTGISLMELANSGATLFPMMSKEDKREVLSLVLSNLRLDKTNVRYNYRKPFDMFVNVTDTLKWRERWDSNPRPSA